MIDVASGALNELEGDIRAGRARDLSDAARMAGEKALGPIVLTTMAYRRALEAREGSLGLKIPSPCPLPLKGRETLKMV